MDYELCSPDANCAACDAERATREAREAAAREVAATPPAPAVLIDEGVIYVPDVVDADAILVAIGPSDDGTVTLTREDARRVVSTLATRRSPDDVVTIESLRARLDGASTRLDAARDAHRRDIATIGAALMEQAEDRDWCGIYDEVVEEINANLTVSLPLRSRDITIYLSDDDGRNHFYLSVSVSGDEDEADAARQVLDMLRGQVNDWGYA